MKTYPSCHKVIKC